MEIQLITEDACAFCDDAKDILDRLSTEFPVSVTTITLESLEGQALAERAGIMFAPGILIDGEPFSYGRPSEKKLRRELDRRMAATRGG